MADNHLHLPHRWAFKLGSASQHIPSPLATVICSGGSRQPPTPADPVRVKLKLFVGLLGVEVLSSEVGPWWPVAISVLHEENTSEKKANTEEQSRELMKEHLNG